MYEVKMMNGDIFKITEEEVKLIGGKSGLIPIPSIKSYINTSSIVSASPIGIAINKASQNEMILHDGLRAIKKNGYWVNANNQEAKIDGNFYPEIYKDNLPISQ